MVHILVVDDDPDILSLIHTILSQADYKVTTASSGLETLDMLGIQPENPAAELPALILLDLMLPKMDGYGVGAIIRNNPRTRDIPVLIVTALQEVSRLFAATVEINGLVTKPFTPQDLLDKVTEALKNPKAYRTNPYLDNLLKA